MEAIKLQNVSSEMVAPNSTTELDATLAVSSAAVSFASSDFPASCKYVRMQVQGDSVRITYDGSAPTSSNGELVQSTQMTIVNRAVALRMRFIRVTTDAVIWAQPHNVLAQ
jgi:hypothetical protein